MIHLYTEFKFKISIHYGDNERKQNRESTEGYSKCIVRKNNGKFEKKIVLNKQNICKSQMGRDQVSKGVSVHCQHATPVTNVL